MARIAIYSPTDPIVAHRVTLYLLSANTPDYDGEPNKVVNPDLTALANVPQKYWKHSAGSIVEMTQGEKDAWDASIPGFETPSLVAEPTTAGSIGTGGYTAGRRAGYIGTSATTTQVVRGSSYTPGSGNATRYVKSLSANDTAAGTGARKVRIYYHSYSGGLVSAIKTTDVTLNGTTEVATSVSDIAFIEKIEVLEVGSGGGNAGTIQLLLTSGGAIMGSIPTGDNQTYWAHHYVPSGKTCFVTDVVCAAKSIAGVSTLQCVDPTSAVAVQKNLDVTFAYGTTLEPWQFKIPIKVTGPAIFWLTTKPDSATASTTHGGFGFFET